MADRSARASTWESISAAAPATSANPPTIWDRIAPLFPLAPMSTARLAAIATAAGPSAAASARPVASSRAVSARFEPVSPSGTG